MESLVKASKPQSGYGRLASLIMPTIILVAAIIISLNTYNDSRRSELASFNDRATVTANGMTNRLNEYRNLLFSSAAFLSANDEVTQTQWTKFFLSQDAFSRYQGISAISYVKLVNDEDLSAFVTKMRTSDYFGPSYAIRNRAAGPQHALVYATASNNDVKAVLGYDMLSDPMRKAVFEAAASKNVPIGSPPITLATGYKGFFVTLPHKVNGQVDGYVLMSFRFNDLMKAQTTLLGNGLSFRLSDVTDAKKPVTLYTSPQWSNSNDSYTRDITVGGRQWQLVITEPNQNHNGDYFVPAVIMATSLVLVVALYAVLRNEHAARNR